MDALKLVSSWSSKGLKDAVLSLRVEGVLIQGAAFDGKILREAEANATELEKLQVGGNDEMMEEAALHCPDCLFRAN